MRPLLLFSVTAVVVTTFGLTPKASNSPGPPLIESFEGSSGDICSGHVADVDDPERKLDDGLSGMPYNNEASTFYSSLIYQPQLPPCYDEQESSL